MTWSEPKKWWERLGMTCAIVLVVFSGLTTAAAFMFTGYEIDRMNDPILLDQVRAQITLTRTIDRGKQEFLNALP